MSYEYDQYLQQHKSNVLKGYCWLEDNLPEIFNGDPELMTTTRWQIEFNHDSSKTGLDEYEAYNNYFYGNNKSFNVVAAFNKAWLLHIHRNPHHWQYWVLIHDDPNKVEECIEMPYNYILEMICDWWSFSWNSGRLTEIFNWYYDHKNHIKFHENTRKIVEKILDKMEKKLDNSLSEIMHHGIKGQKWGIRRDKQELELARKNDIIVLEAIDSGTVSAVINRHKQDRHTKGGHLSGRSYVKGNLEYSQKLVDKYSGTGEPILDSNGNWTNKERVVADKKVGIYVDKDGKETETSNLLITYSNTGTHVYPRKDDINEK